MSSSEGKKHVSASGLDDVQNHEGKTTGPNYLDLSKTIRIYLKSIRMASLLTKDTPTDDSKEQ